MAGYLDTYGVSDARRIKLIKRFAIGAVSAAVIGLLLFLFLRNFSERRIANRFLDAVKSGQYQRAYETWGCTAANPCRDYKFEKFMEDWGPSGIYAKVKEGKYTIEDACGPGVVFTLELPGNEPVGIYVKRDDKTMSYAPWPRCPGRHLHLWEFIKSRFS
jgi:hypothetical protein